MIVVGRIGRRIAIETRVDGSIRARWYVDGQKERITIPNIRVAPNAETLSPSDYVLAEEIGWKMSHAISRGEDPRGVIDQLRVNKKPPVLGCSLGVIGTAYFSETSNPDAGEDSMVNYRKYYADLKEYLGEAFDLNTLSVSTVELLSKKLAQECVDDWHTHVEVFGQYKKALIAWEEKKRKRLIRKNAKRPKKISEPPAQVVGHVRTQKTISWLYTLARWGADRLMVQQRSALPQNWKEKVKKAWLKATRQSPKVARPAYSLDETMRLYAVRRKMDPRLQNMLEVGLGSRLGQLRRVRRSDLDLTNDGCSKGRLTIPDGGPKKPGMTIDFSDRSFNSMSMYLNTYLAPWENKFLNGEISDYFLYPGGDLISLAQSTGDEETPCMTEQYLGDLFDAAERLADVTKIAKRRLHGLRRFARTAAARMEKDTRVLDRLIGHNSRGVGGLYEDPQDAWVRARTLKVREALITKVT